MISSHSLAKNFTIQTVGKILSVLIGLITIAIITRALGTERFGEYTTALTFLQFFGVLVDFGLTLTLMIMISEAGADEKRIIGNFFGLRLVSGFIFFTLAPLTVLFFPWSETIKYAVLIGAFAYFLMGGATMLIGVFQKHEAMWRSALAELINRLVLAILIAGFAFAHFGVLAMIFASVIANLIWLGMMIVYAKPLVHIHPLFEKTIWQQIFSRSWPIAISIIFNLMYLKGDVLLLAYFRSQTEVGLYGVAYRVLDILTVLPTMFMGLLLPSLVFAWSGKDYQKFRARLARTFDLFMIGIIPIIVGTQVVGVRLIQFIAGDAFIAGGSILTILILATFGVFVGTLFGHLVVALNKQRVMIFGYAITAILTLLGYLYFIPKFGMNGAAWMTVFSETLIAIITCILVCKTAQATLRLNVFFKVCLSSFIMYGFFLVVPRTQVLLDILFGALVYLVALILLKGINLQDLQKFLPKKFKNDL